MEIEIKTFLGEFKGNILTLPNGDTMSCLTYGCNKEIIEGKTLFCNAKRLNEEDWLIFQFVLI